jgi:chromosomal replication initiator protein
MPSVWSACREELEREVSATQFNTWIAPLQASESTAGVLTLIAPNRFILQWVRERFAARIESIATALSGEPVRIEFEVGAEGAGAAASGGALDGAGQSAEGRPASNALDAEAAITEAEIAAAEAAEAAAQAETAPAGDATGRGAQNGRNSRGSRSSKSGNGADTAAPTAAPSASTAAAREDRSALIEGFTFDSLVPGKANQMARAAALQVAEHPGVSYNPLFIYGGVGLGKTHLIHAVGHHVRSQNPRARIRYLHASEYVTSVVRAYQQRSFDEFKRYYHSLDLLLIDDIQFFTGKDRTQEEFFYAFNALHDAKKQVIITCDTYPKDIEGVEERLKSRFLWGLTVSIDPPEQEMRVAIVLKKAESMGVKLPDDVAFFIARNISSNVRELEGALRSVLAFARFNQRDITMDLAREALKDILSINNRQVTVDNIQRTVAEFYRIRITDMHSPKRSRQIARPRQIAMALTKELTSMSLPEIGEAFGGRDHTTVLHACRQVASLRDSDPAIGREYQMIEQSLKG